MGVCGSSSNKLSPSVEADLKEIFNKIDVDGNQSIDKEETKAYW